MKTAALSAIPPLQSCLQGSHQSPRRPGQPLGPAGHTADEQPHDPANPGSGSSPTGPKSPYAGSCVSRVWRGGPGVADSGPGLAGALGRSGHGVPKSSGAGARGSAKFWGR